MVLPHNTFTSRNWGWLYYFRRLGIACALLLLLGTGACEKKAVQSAPSAPAPVEVEQVALKTVPVQLRAIGRVEAFSSVSIKAQVSGEVTAVHFTEGQDVKKGDLLFSIDRRTPEAALRQAEANLARDIAQAENARTQAARYQKLFDEGVAAKQQVDAMIANADAYDATVRADRAAIETAKVQLSYTSIYAPMDGRTGSLMVFPGNLVKANDNPVLLVINQIQPAYVTFSVPEQSLAEIKRFMAAGKLPVQATIPGDAGAPVRGTLSFVDNTVDAATGTIRLKATYANEARRLWPGQFVDVMLTLSERPDAVVVPSQAVQTGQMGTFVFVVKQDMTAESRPVSVGATVGGLTVVENGLRPGELVVTDGQLRITPNGKVVIKSK